MTLHESITALENFIADFELKDGNGVVSFSGTIHFLLDGHLKIFESNVQIITSNHLDTIYMVNNLDGIENLPDMLDPKHFAFAYTKMEYLHISPLEINPKLAISIFPRTI